MKRAVWLKRRTSGAAHLFRPGELQSACRLQWFRYCRTVAALADARCGLCERKPGTRKARRRG